MTKRKRHEISSSPGPKGRPFVHRAAPTDVATDRIEVHQCQWEANQSIKHEHPETLEQNKCKELNVGFSMNLLNAIYRNCCADASSTQNTVLSPISAAMAYAGARGQTAAEFVNLLANGDGSSLHQNNAKFIEEIQSEKTFNLSIANKIFLNERSQCFRVECNEWENPKTDQRTVNR
ncbi:hypothetical protein niasHT_028550 [Heterodera trifolii]|uniref:Serpin domain-containing protein n=1 Tax=Heterodera trifolii TaxID=157864 RepID=A0ABD2JNY8_9BILA